MSDNTERPEDDSSIDPREELKRSLGENRLPPGPKEQVLAELPPSEELKRLYRELQENGGFSFEQLFDPLDSEAEPQP
jgi:hypothetical protein